VARFDGDVAEVHALHPADGIPARELQPLTGLTPKNLAAWLTRLGKWWGYLTVDRAGVVRPTAGGRRAQTIWLPLTGTIETRWEVRFGKPEIDALRNSLSTVAQQLDSRLPDYLPILGYGLFSKPADSALPAASSRSIPGLLAKVLLAFAIEFERDSEVSLAISANVLRLGAGEGVLVRDLPRDAGVSKEAIAMCLGSLQKRGYAVIETEAAGRFKRLVLTPKGRRARDRYHALVGTIEENWRSSFGEDAVAALRSSLERLAGDGTEPPLFGGLNPPPGTWRASLPKPTVLPHYPMVLHRGGYPDGS
jgi:DNA-binding MarR family transcriptional regulator